MEMKTLGVGRKYLYRRGARYPHRNENPAIKVSVVAVAETSRRVKVRHESGNHAGLEEFVSPRELLCEWKARKPWLRDERRMDRLREHYRLEDSDPTLCDAVNVVLHASGEYAVACTGMYGIFGGDADAVGRLLDRAGVEGGMVALDPELGWTDRDNFSRLSWPAALKLAKALVAAEPAVMLHAIAAEEADLTAGGYGDSELHRHLAEVRPSHAVVQRWAGADQEASELRTENARLRGLLGDAASALDASGDARSASRLRRRTGLPDV